MVRCSNTRRPSNTCEMPSFVTSKAGMPSMRWPSSVMVPLVTVPRSVRSTPDTAFSVVVLPAPLPPSSVVMEPGFTSSDTPFSTRMMLS